MSLPTPDPSNPGPSPTGEQWTIAHGGFAATIVEVGGGLRLLTHDGVDVVAGYDTDEPCQSGRGQQLMPWPNRIRDGRYCWGDTVTQQLPLTEVELDNASHGLVRWALWELVEHADSSVTVGYRLHPQPGWRHHLDLRTTYRLDDSGLVVTTTARNVGRADAPFGYGAHPYLSIGDTELSEVTLTVPANQRVEVDERSLPVATLPVEHTEYDFREARPVGSTDLDTAYTEIDGDADGRWRVSVAADDRRVTLWADPAFTWLQVFTGAARLHKGLAGIAVEPMTCPADAFNSRTSLVTLAPGDEWTGTWGISPG
ncbi:galactose mutarotase [Humibacillus sp. DSM 29435]|uniref:aldose 1-epimerase family protein n=1 Tax=Humibacillus sp. DSM 29435 TaxID=1869167 RepID=UPI000871F207|nr:aldose 1-epimerase family protein [Humibacillus sp. DSM 29435]OFE15134.1 galactose mutarotase [Humibacillus sp. DSM 29435]